MTPGPLPESRLRSALWGPSEIEPWPSGPLVCLQTSPKHAHTHTYTHTLLNLFARLLAATAHLLPTHRKSEDSEATQGWMGKPCLRASIWRRQPQVGRERADGWDGRHPRCGCQHMLLACRPLLMQSPLPGMPLTRSPSSETLGAVPFPPCSVFTPTPRPTAPCTQFPRFHHSGPGPLIRPLACEWPKGRAWVCFLSAPPVHNTGWAQSTSLARTG